ncbi:MAG: response regulator [Bacteroidia bacterium]|nr:response regulator [Bacteroidia bacterium]
MKHLPNLLIVDDTEINLTILESIIKKIKVNLIKAESGSEALQKTQGIELALAIIDVRMPGMNGYELALKMNEERSDDKVPIIFLTANYINEMEVFKGYDTGAVDYISKPIHNHILISKINVFLDLFNQKQTIIRDVALLKESADELTMANTALKKSEEKLKGALEQLQQLTQYTEKAREEERKSISRELHDDLGQALTAVKIDLGIIRQIVSDSEVVVKINIVSALVGETIKTVQRLTSQLRPEILDDLGLEAAIEWYTNEFSQRNGVEVMLLMDSGLAIAPDTSLTLFRIMQESLTNIARHSKATRVEIVLRTTSESINFRISDNGIGITENEIKSKKSFGIIGMRERAASLGGTLDIYRENDHGTEIKLIFPLK